MPRRIAQRRSARPSGRKYFDDLIGTCGHSVDFSVTVSMFGKPNDIEYLCEVCEKYVRLTRKKPQKRQPRPEVDGQETLPPF